MGAYFERSYDELTTSSLGIEIPDDFSLGERCTFLKMNWQRTVVLQELRHIAEHKAFYLMNAYHTEEFHAWPANTPVEQIVSELEQNGWECSVKTGEDGIEIECTNHEALETLFKLFSKIKSIRGMADENVVCVDQLIGPEMPYMFEPDPEPELPGAEFGFLRFGEPPASGFSQNGLLGIPEKGVSCFHAEIAPNGDYQFTQMTPVLCEDVMLLTDEYKRPLYRLYGEVVGHGSDGEPLLKVVKAERFTGKYIGQPLEDLREKALREVFPFYLYG